ncbi:hypothetical protein Patl1_17470 [Pistacia atlantica]|uniref:Uncharacterized protein n=1 Tax=Pistacia atlantica TaxID=434234 RepID=A0ACC1BYZ7_9ROSI|nr:hypothetical protein Patl1_17470 [Pistacia atlantica]
MSRPRVKASMFLLLISLICISSSSAAGRVMGHVDNANPANPTTEQFDLMVRRMIELNAVVNDYEKPGPNRNHYPPGKGGR